ncbi:flagellar motor protein MotB [Acidomonas methanolica]|uniref:Chemotaxis protein MotB n=3 Tax=Acidomonas methanolica TaxID=437 RepID=A0A023D3V3_ACIMT|nr:flagellar motor protein MotB [Acidomonas methanolica]MBU2653641.1 OmpA family protein [Acidomonas methanolica]TCS31593.1 chemotaxis protein MotB [Acidomonas methanolica]GAJ28807.1 chemotaxis protein MotB [Acidomonas methanolica NBRC 104435]GEK98011.1 membrane protein [Acidomonas methanolica NBRC 104435]
MARGATRRGDNSGRTIIVRRGGDGAAAHHGGAWKIAYGDFVTAMMAFFLVMWLINATTEEQRRGIANFFDPLATNMSQPLDAMTPPDPSVLARSMRKSPVESPPGRSPGAAGGVVTRGARRGDGRVALGEQPYDSIGQWKPQGVSPTAPPQEMPPGATASSGGRQAAATKVAAVRERLRRALSALPDGKAALARVRVGGTSDDIRISIEDSDHEPMFARGQTMPDAHVVAMLEAIVPVVEQLPGTLTISGYTDSSGYGPGPVNNWSLSALRADAARGVLEKSGFPSDRFGGVMGMADRSLADPEHPLSPVNRRIVLTMTRKAIPPSGSPNENAGAQP